MAMINVSGPGMKGMVGMAARVFAVMSRAGISVVLITQSPSEYSISFYVPQHELRLARRVLEDEFYLELKDGVLEPLDVMEKLAIISVVCDGMHTLRGISARFFSALACANINIVAIAQGYSERSISVVVSNDAVTTGVRVSHQILFNTDQVIEVFIIGVGGRWCIDRTNLPAAAVAEAEAYRSAGVRHRQLVRHTDQCARYPAATLARRGGRGAGTIQPRPPAPSGEGVSPTEPSDRRLYLQLGGGRSIRRLPG